MERREDERSEKMGSYRRREQPSKLGRRRESPLQRRQEAGVRAMQYSARLQEAIKERQEREAEREKATAPEPFLVTSQDNPHHPGPTRNTLSFTSRSLACLRRSDVKRLLDNDWLLSMRGLI